jgi:hypothetical protein
LSGVRILLKPDGIISKMNSENHCYAERFCSSFTPNNRTVKIHFGQLKQGGNLVLRGAAYFFDVGGRVNVAGNF